VSGQSKNKLFKCSYGFITDPKRLLRVRKQKLYTARALYYQDDRLQIIGPDRIGGIDCMSLKKKKDIANICSRRLQFGDGMPLYRVIERPNIPDRLVNIRETENGRK
jgi:hypothetical protein